MDKQETQQKLNEKETSMDIDDKVLTEQELIELECPTDSEEPLEVAMEYDLKL
jgi:hypothetical protein